MLNSFMKSYTAVMVVAIGVCVTGVVKCWPQSSHDAHPRPRFEQIDHEDHRTPDDYGPSRFIVYRDRETGQEIVCAREGRDDFKSPTSCWLTGRKW